MLTVVTILGVYLLGVVISIVAIAWVNSDSRYGEGITPISSALSWITIFALLVMVLAYPFSIFYNWCLDKFDSRGK